MFDFKYIQSGNTITVWLEGKRTVLTPKHPAYILVRDVLSGGDVSGGVVSGGDVSGGDVSGGDVSGEVVAQIIADNPLRNSLFAERQGADGGVEYLFEGEPVHKALSERLHTAYGEQEAAFISAAANFMTKLRLNPLAESIHDVYAWISSCHMPLTPSGNFLAYKRVRANYRDCHTGTFDNSPGKTVEMPREDVDPDRYSECSTGLHFCSKQYLTHFGGERTLIVEIDPSDVVAIPINYNRSKGRAWRYKVLGEVSQVVIDHFRWDHVQNPEDIKPETEDVYSERSTEEYVEEFSGTSDNTTTTVDEVVEEDKFVPTRDNPNLYRKKRSVKTVVTKTPVASNEFFFEGAEGNLETPIGYVTAKALMQDMEEMKSQRRLAEYYKIPRSTLWAWIQRVRRTKKAK